MNKNRWLLACALIAFGAVFSSNVFGTLDEIVGYPVLEQLALSTKQPSTAEQKNEREEDPKNIASTSQDNNKKLEEALENNKKLEKKFKEALDKSKECEKKLEEAVTKNQQLKEKNKKNIKLQKELKENEKELEENLTSEREKIKDLEENLTLKRGKIKNLEEALEKIRKDNYEDAFNSVSEEKRELQKKYDEFKSKYEPSASEEEIRRQKLLEEEQRIGAKYSQDRWFGFSTGFVVPFIYSFVAGKSFDSLKFGMSERASRATLEASLGLMAINAVVSSIDFNNYSAGKRTFYSHLLRGQWAMINPIAKRLLGPVACSLVNDHYVLPLVSSLLFGLVGDKCDNEGNRMAWSHQAGIIGGMLAGRTCNEGIKFVGRILSRNKTQAAA